jgi:hypothetical protein
MRRSEREEMSTVRHASGRAVRRVRREGGNHWLKPMRRHDRRLSGSDTARTGEDAHVGWSAFFATVINRFASANARASRSAELKACWWFVSARCFYGCALVFSRQAQSPRGVSPQRAVKWRCRDCMHCRLRGESAACKVALMQFADDFALLNTSRPHHSGASTAQGSISELFRLLRRLPTAIERCPTVGSARLHTRRSAERKTQGI